MLREFKDVFLDEIIGLPPQQYIDFIIDLILGVIPVTKDPYRMSTHKLIEMYMYL